MTLPSSTDRLVPQDLVMFHGGRIVGPVELRPRAKSMAYGPGFYLTTSYWTAREYRGGNGFVYKVRIAGDLRWAHRVQVTMTQAEAFLASIPKLKRRKEVIADLRGMLARRKKDTMSFVAIMNTLDIHQSYGASVAKSVAEALVAAGVDATFVSSANSGNEDWMVLHNVSKVRSIEALTTVAEDMPRFPEDFES